MLSKLRHPLRYDAADALNAERYAITDGGKRVLALALAAEAKDFCDRLKAAFDAEEFSSAKPRDSTTLPCPCCRTIHDPEAHDA